jgi:hypothetical protein
VSRAVRPRSRQAGACHGLESQQPLSDPHPRATPTHLRLPGFRLSAPIAAEGGIGSPASADATERSAKRAPVVENGDRCLDCRHGNPLHG